MLSSSARRTGHPRFAKDAGLLTPTGGFGVIS